MQSEFDAVPIGELDFLKHIAEVSNLSLARNLIEKAPAAVEKELAIIRGALENNDIQTLKDACHSLKGACYSVRVVRLAEMTAAMENASSDMSQAKLLMKPLETVAEQTIAWWRDVLDKDLI